ncbi:MAG: TetR/AcrR family transcriptional regulator [Breznakibacter sp.]
MAGDSQSTELKIKEAAVKVFLSKGFDGATTRAIAQEVGMNLALVNYYFRSKEKLFTAIFEEMIQLFMEGMVEVFNRPMGLKEKICALIDHDFEMFKNHPDLVIFVLSEVHRNPERFFKLIQVGAMKSVFEKNSLLDQQFRQAIDLGLIRPINPDNAVFMITSSMHMLFTGKKLIMQMNEMDESQYEEFANQQKEITKDMILRYLFV